MALPPAICPIDLIGRSRNRASRSRHWPSNCCRCSGTSVLTPRSAINLDAASVFPKAVGAHKMPSSCRSACPTLPALRESFRSPPRKPWWQPKRAGHTRALHQIRSLYVILDIREPGSDAERTAGLAERRGEDAPFQRRSSGRSRIPAAQIAER